MTALAAVTPLHGEVKPTRQSAVAAELPEPVQLYGLTVLAFVLHVDENGMCAICPETWPCAHLRLAYRLREGF